MLSSVEKKLRAPDQLFPVETPSSGETNLFIIDLKVGLLYFSHTFAHVFYCFEWPVFFFLICLNLCIIFSMMLSLLIFLLIFFLSHVSQFFPIVFNMFMTIHQYIYPASSPYNFVLYKFWVIFNTTTINIK